MAEPPALPRATYRVQFRDGFDFADAVAIVPYLADLGISHLYASPIFQARTGSTHGYDAVDVNRIDPALGGEAGFDPLCLALRDHGMGLLLDIVPNHMGVGPDNGWWQDVLAKGQASEFANFFDIDWEAGGGRLVLPFLGAPLAEVLAAGEVSAEVDADSAAPVLRYYDHRWPIAEDSLDGPAETERSLQARLEQITRDPAALSALIERQAYRLIHWRDGPARINYRRFFEVDDLAALAMERDEVFEASHRLLLRLIGERKVQGVRLDHIDGMLDPLGYCRRLANAAAAALGLPAPSLDDLRAGRPIYLVAEKILGHGEELPAALMAAGTTGYELMTALGELMVDPAAEAAFDDIKTAFGGEQRPFATIAAEAKVEVLTSSFAGELDRLSSTLHALTEAHPATADLTREKDCRDALIRLITAFPVYRSYVGPNGASAEDRHWIGKALEAASIPPPLADLLERVLAGAVPDGARFALEDALGFAMKLQLLTGPVMAKAVEDRAFYRDVRLVSLNDVGGEPAVFGGSIENFHRWVETRQTRQPAGMLTTATHDHKRGEDVRARLHVLSEMPATWRRAVLNWQRLNAGLVKTIDGRPAPGAEDQYLIYQTLLGIWPQGLEPSDREGLEQLGERLVAYMQKASREAAQRTAWTAVDDAYEQATVRFVRTLLAPETSPAFLDELVDFAARLMRPGMVNGLAQTALKLTLPGVPDIYRGTEIWDLSLVDPDNRRPVDFSSLAGLLDGVTDLLAAPDDWSTGLIKQRLIRTLLQLRKAEPALFAAGDYLPIDAVGTRADHVLAFARSHGRQSLLIAVPRLMSDQSRRDPDSGETVIDWADTRLLLPTPLRSRTWNDVLTETGGMEAETDIPLARPTGPLPLAVLMSD